ncbi:MAG: hypothetical protein ACKPAH_14465 [Verrucomicrobiota bacterium]
MKPLNRTLLIAAASLMVGSSALALTSTETQALTDKILASRVVDMPAVAAKLVIQAEKAERIETAKTAVVAVAKNYPKALSAVVGAVVRKAPETTEAVVAACLEAAPSMARTVVAAATFASVGQDMAILSVVDRLAPAQQQEVKTEMALALARRIEGAGKFQGQSAAKARGTITIPGADSTQTQTKTFETKEQAEEVFARIILNVDPKATYNPQNNTFTLPANATPTPNKVIPTPELVTTRIESLFSANGVIDQTKVVNELKTSFKTVTATKSLDNNREINLYASP